MASYGWWRAQREWRRRQARMADVTAHRWRRGASNATLRCGVGDAAATAMREGKGAAGGEAEEEEAEAAEEHMCVACVRA